MTLSSVLPSYLKHIWDYLKLGFHAKDVEGKKEKLENLEVSEVKLRSLLGWNIMAAAKPVELSEFFIPLFCPISGWIWTPLIDERHEPQASILPLPWGEIRPWRNGSAVCVPVVWLAARRGEKRQGEAKVRRGEVVRQVNWCGMPRKKQLIPCGLSVQWGAKVMTPLTIKWLVALKHYVIQ